MKKINILLTILFLFALKLSAQPDYKAIAPFFKKYISEEGIVDYKALKKNKSEFEKILKKFTSTPPKEDWYKNEHLAYWLNVYNLQMMWLLVESYPSKNIMDLYDGKIWQQKYLKIEEKRYCLDEIEKNILRKEWNEPRLVFALYSGAISSPTLLNDVFTPANVYLNFELLTKRFINSPQNTITEEKIELSKIFDWYKADFKDVVGFINKYSKMKIAADAKISYQAFNWKLKESEIKPKITPTIPVVPAF